MEKQSQVVIPVFDLILCLAQAVDLVSPLVAEHHERTAQIAYSLGKQMELPEDELRDLVTAAALHDAGGLTSEDRLGTLDFEFHDPYGHSINGYLLLKTFGPFQNAAEIVRYHHVRWLNGAGACFDGRIVPRCSHLLQLADRIAVLIDPHTEILEQVDSIMEKIRELDGERFDPVQVRALEKLAEKEAFWLDTIYLQNLSHLDKCIRWQEMEITQDDFLGLINLFRRIIDFRSQFTATHSAGVAATAEKLARLHQFSEVDCRLIHLSGLLHDLGKLAVPAEILDKPGTLTKEEFDLMRRHTYYTFHILEPIKILDVVRVWGAFHHERMDGHGYPFHLEENELSLGSRIVSIADIYTALTEDRPYRSGLGSAEALRMLSEAAEQHRVDNHVVAVLRDHLEEVEAARYDAQCSAMAEYRLFVETAAKLTHKS